MTLWCDAHLSPRTAKWIAENFDVESKALRDLGLRDAKDAEIFTRARAENAVVMTKDADFVRLQELFGPPPKIIWLTCGNTSDAALRLILTKHLATALRLLDSGEPLVEIGRTE